MAKQNQIIQELPKMIYQKKNKLSPVNFYMRTKIKKKRKNFHLFKNLRMKKILILFGKKN